MRGTKRQLGRRRTAFAAVVLHSLGITIPASAAVQVFDWTEKNGEGTKWDDNDNWHDQVAGSAAGRVPQTGDDALIRSRAKNGGAVIYANSTAGTLLNKVSLFGDALLEQSKDTLTTQEESMHGGQLDVKNLAIHNVGTPTKFGNLKIGGPAETPSLINFGNIATATSPSPPTSWTTYGREIIGWGGRGIFKQWGGTHVVAGDDLGLIPGAAFGGGVLTIAGDAETTLSSAYYLRGGLLQANELEVGMEALGIFEQTGGRNVVSGTLRIGDKPAANDSIYKLLNANSTLDAAQVLVGVSGLGRFEQDDGSTVTITQRLSLGHNNNGWGQGQGYYTLGDGTLTVRDAVIGYEGTGIFKQDDGVSTFSGTLILGQQEGGYGSFTLWDGDFSAVDVVINRGLFRQGGGASEITGRLRILGNSHYDHDYGILISPQVNLDQVASRLEVGDGADARLAQVAGPGGLVVNTGGMVRFAEPGPKSIEGTTVENAGTVSVGAVGVVTVSNGATINNTGLFDLQGNAGLADGGGSPVVNNYGTFRKSAGAGVSLVTVPFESPGTVDVQAGTVSLDGPVSSRGYYFSKDGPGTLAVRGPQSYGQAGQTNVTVNVNGGTMALYTDAGAGYGRPYVVVGGLGPAATLSLHATQHLLGATVNPGATVA